MANPRARQVAADREQMLYGTREELSRREAYNQAHGMSDGVNVMSIVIFIVFWLCQELKESQTLSPSVCQDV